MNLSLLPTTCLAALACMITAGTSHWWSVRQFTVTFDGTSPSLPAAPPSQAIEPETAVAAIPPILPEAHPITPPVGEPIAIQQQFYQELLVEMQTLRNQNRDLLNQVAETNRDLMKLEFRVDTHSEQFRPMPIREDRFGITLDTTSSGVLGTSFDDGPGLLPPRAEPVEPLFPE